MTGTYSTTAPARTSRSASPWKYTGEQEDGAAGDSGYSFLRARYLETATGRFISKNPLPFDQRYVYAHNNPTRFVDPAGLEADDGGDSQRMSAASWNVRLSPRAILRMLRGEVVRDFGTRPATSSSPPASAGTASQPTLPKPAVSDPKLRNYVDDLYKHTESPGRVGDGTTADAIRRELESGLPTHGKVPLNEGDGIRARTTELAEL